MNQPTLKVLLVEDDDLKIKEWFDAVQVFNLDDEVNGFSIDGLSAKSVAQAKKIIQEARLDAVVVDLRLQCESGVEEDNDDGNALIEYIVRNWPLGVIVYTGQGGQANTQEIRQIKVMDKGEGVHQIFDWLASQKDLFLQLRGVYGAVERETAKMFFQSIWPRWERWTTDGRDVTAALARHVTAHVHDSLLHASGGAAHPEETYFMPPLKDRLDTGDMIKMDESVWIVVTPRCDLANNDEEGTLLIAKCRVIANEWQKTDGESSTKKKERQKLMQHNSSHKQHFLPLIFDDVNNQMGPWMVQFNDLQAIPAVQAKSELLPRRIASLAPQFVPSLVERFGAYFSRIGTPNIV